MRRLDRYLQDRPEHSGPLASIEARPVMAMHKIPVLFRVLMKASRLAERVVSGKRIRLNRYTGEPEA